MLRGIAPVSTLIEIMVLQRKMRFFLVVSKIMSIFAALKSIELYHIFKQRSFSYSRMIDNLVMYIEEQVKEDDF